MNRRGLGDQGEELASQLLEAKGYRILERNYRCRFGEIDIIAESKGEIIFVEVKSRSSENFGSPAEAVTSVKLHRIKKTAKTYMIFHQLADIGMRFDVVEIYWHGSKNKISHWEGVI